MYTTDMRSEYEVRGLRGLTCSLLVRWSRFGEEAEKQNGEPGHFARFCFQLPACDICSQRFLPRLQNYQISSNRLGNGDELWAAISERTFVIYCHWLESTFPETGEKIIFADKCLFAPDFFTFDTGKPLQSFQCFSDIYPGSLGTQGTY